MSGESSARAALAGPTKTKGDYNLANLFFLTVDGVQENGVHRVRGLSQKFDIIEFKAGDDHFVHLRPGRPETGRMVITKDLDSTGTFHGWRHLVRQGTTKRSTIAITVLGDDMTPACTYTFYECYPAKFTLGTLSGTTSAHATEEIEVHFERWTLKKG